MKSVTTPPKPKGGTKQVSRKKSATDNAVDAANKKDLRTRNLK